MGIFMSILDFIIDNILINASMVLGLVALIGLVLQRKSVSQCISGTFKTMMGFMILSAGSSVIVGSWKISAHGFPRGSALTGPSPPLKQFWLWPCRSQRSGVISPWYMQAFLSSIF